MEVSTSELLKLIPKAPIKIQETILKPGMVGSVEVPEGQLAVILNMDNSKPLSAKAAIVPSTGKFYPFEFYIQAIGDTREEVELEIAKEYHQKIRALYDEGFPVLRMQRQIDAATLFQTIRKDLEITSMVDPATGFRWFGMCLIGMILTSDAEDIQKMWRSEFKPMSEILVESLQQKEKPMSKQILTNGQPVPEDRSHTELEPSGQQKAYVVLTEEERAKGFVRPVRRSYKHLDCGTVTTMGQALAETYARDPKFYSGTYCAGCCNHYPVGSEGQFVWQDTDVKVGT